MEMVDEAGSQTEVEPERRPRSITLIVVLIWVQVVANALSGWLVLYYAQEDESHGREVSGLVYLLGYGCFLAAAVLAVCAVLLIRRRLAWPRHTVLVIECLLIFYWCVTVFTEDAGGVSFPPVIPVVIVLLLTKKELVNWYDDSPDPR